MNKQIEVTPEILFQIIGQQTVRLEILQSKIAEFTQELEKLKTKDKEQV